MTPSLESQGQKEPVQPNGNNEDNEVNASVLQAKYIKLLEEKIARFEKEDADRAAEHAADAEFAKVIAKANCKEDEVLSILLWVFALQ